MALSGSFSSSVGSHWKLQLEWSGKQNIEDNTTTVTAKLYWIADSYGAINSSASKSGSITIDGSSYSFSGSGLASLSNGQKKLLKTASKTISHNSDGTKSISLDASFGAEVTLGSTYYGTIGLTAKSYSLNTIPRASSLTSSANWTAGDNRSISISRASSGFTHTVKISVNGTLIKTLTGVGTSATASFSTAENTSIFNQLNTNSSEDTKIEVITYSGSTQIGSKSYTGTVTAPSRSTTSAPTSFDIGASISGSITRKDSEFTHTIQLIFGSSTFTLASKTTSTSWSYNTSSIASSLYALTPNSNTLSGKVRITTYYNSEQVGDPAESSIKCYVKNSNPTFTASQVTYADTNATTTAITGNNQYVIQNKSTVRVTIGSVATAKNSATIKSYDITVNGRTLSLTGTGYKDFGTVDAGNSFTLKVRVVDSRGNATEVTKTVNVIPYKDPVITPTAQRTNNFESETTIKLGGSISLLTISSTNKNSIKALQYRYKSVKTTTWGSWVNFAKTQSGANYTATNVVLNLDNTLAYDFEFKIQDAVTTVTVAKQVAVGKPIFFIDANLKSIGFNDLPVGAEEFRVNGKIIFGQNMYASGAGSGESGGGALFLNNSDITGVNGLYFNDVSNNHGEGLLFLKSGAPTASPTNTDYDSMYIRDGVLYFNDGNGEIKIANNVNFNNKDLLNANVLTFNDPGANEGIKWTGGNEWQIYESPNDLSNAKGNLQFVVGSTRAVTIGADGVLQAVKGIYTDAVKSRFGNIYFNGYNTMTNDNDGIMLSGKGTMTLNNTLSGTARLDVGKDSSSARIWTTGVYERTYSSGSTMTVTSEGTLGRISSAKKYKLAIEEVDTDSIAERILNLQPKSWYDKKATEAYAEYLSKLQSGEITEDAEDDIPYLQRHYGLIAEDLIDVGLDMYVLYGDKKEDGTREVEGLEYERVWTLLIPLVREQREEINSLKEQVAYLMSAQQTGTGVVIDA